MYKRPVSLHCVKAYGNLYDFIANAKKSNNLPPAIMLHSYSGSADCVKMFEKLRLPIYFSFSQVVSTRGIKMDDAIRQVPDGKILVESDLHDPELIDKGLIDIISMISQAKGWSEDVSCQILEENSSSFFLSVKHQQ